MKTKEFIEKVETLDYTVQNNGLHLVVYTKGGSIVARLNIHCQQIEIETWTYGSQERLELLYLMTNYTLTEPNDREEEKQYRLRLKAPIVENPLYLHYGGYSKNFSIACLGNGDTFKTIFTESEIAEMDITGFEPEEVEG